MRELSNVGTGGDTGSDADGCARSKGGVGVAGGAGGRQNHWQEFTGRCYGGQQQRI